MPDLYGVMFDVVTESMCDLEEHFVDRQIAGGEGPDGEWLIPDHVISCSDGGLLSEYLLRNLVRAGYVVVGTDRVSVRVADVAARLQRDYPGQSAEWCEREANRLLGVSPTPMGDPLPGVSVITLT